MSDIQSFRQAVESFIAARGWTPTRFGRAIAGDPLFVFDLREGREPRSDTRTRILKAMQDHADTQSAAPLRIGVAVHLGRPLPALQDPWSCEPLRIEREPDAVAVHSTHPAAKPVRWTARH